MSGGASYYVLHYEFVEGIKEKRAPYRKQHLDQADKEVRPVCWHLTAELSCHNIWLVGASNSAADMELDRSILDSIPTPSCRRVSMYFVSVQHSQVE